MWSFLASILLALESRYIGISFQGASIAVIFVYISDRIKRASFIQSDRFHLASLVFFTTALRSALQEKYLWRMNFMQ